MQGLEIAEEYYRTYGKPMLDTLFPDEIASIAAGVAGEGSECFGFDDELSRDHDFDQGFCLWITRQDYDRFGFRLERAYARLPKEFRGLRRQTLSPVGGNRRGVMVIEDFYRRFLGADAVPEDVRWWLDIPHESLACACNGKVFMDNKGAFSAVRRRLLEGYPEDVRRKKLAAFTLLAAQSGQYNYARCVKRGEYGAAQLAAVEFVRSIVSAVYLLNHVYEPFYKWTFAGMRRLPILGGLAPALEALIQLGNGEEEFPAKSESIEEIAAMLIRELTRRGLSDRTGGDLEVHAFAVQNTVADGMLRTMHILSGV